MAALAACGGGSSGGSSAVSTSQYGNVPLIVSDATSDDWATVGVQILSVALVPQGGGANVTVYTAPSTPPYVNLEQLDQLGEIIGNAQVPVGSYTGAVLTVAGNPGDVMLVTSEDPQTGFAGSASETIATSDIQIQHTQGSSGSLTVPIDVTFVAPLMVTANSSNALDLEFDLSHPAFIVAHQPASGPVLWGVNFTGPVRHHPIADITKLVLRQHYGQVTAIASGGTTLTVDKVYPTLPLANPEQPIVTLQPLTITVDSTNGTLFYDLDSSNTPSTITSFANVTGLSANQYLRIQARFQQDGTLVATRIWASSSFDSVWVGPEGHVMHVDSANNAIWVSTETGSHVPLTINSGTQFYFHGGTTAIGSGTSFLANDDLVRGFKVHASVVDPLANPLVAQSIDIEQAAYSGAISAVSTSGFTYTHDYVRASDDYSMPLPYINPMSDNGTYVDNTAVVGFDYWNFAYPTMITSGSAAIGDFLGATTGPITAVGISDATWGDPANMNGWSAPWSILLPVPLALSTVTSGLVASGDAYAFTLTPAGAASALTIDVSNISGQATLVYQVDRSNGILSISPIDITTSSGLATLTDALTAGTLVKVYGVPNSAGDVQSYVLLYFTSSSGAMPVAG
jgi:hypothetical protein